MAKKHEEKEAPEAVKKWKKLQKHAKRILDTTEHHHRVAYDKALKEHLMEGDLIVYDKLDEDEVQREFAETMSEHYIEQAKKYFKVHKDLNELEKELLMNAYAGTTKAQLRQLISEHGKSLSFDKFLEEKKKWLQQLGKALVGATTYHITDEHVEDIIKYVGLEDVIDPENMPREKAIELLRIYEEKGALSPEDAAKSYKAMGLVGVLTKEAKHMLGEKEKKRKKELGEEIEEYRRRVA